MENRTEKAVGEETAARLPRFALTSGWTAAFIIAMGIILGVAGAAYAIYAELWQSRARVEDTYVVLRAIDRVMADLRDAETGQRGYLLTGKSEFLQPYEDAAKKIQDDLAALSALLGESPTERERISVFAQLADTKMAELARTISDMREGRAEHAIAQVLAGEGKQAMDRLRDLAAAMSTCESDLLQERFVQLVRLRWITAAIFAIVLLLVAGVIIAAFLANADLAMRRSQLEQEVKTRTAAQRTLVEKEEQYRITLASIGDAVIATNARGRVMYMNPVAEDLTGWNFTEAKDRPVEEIFQIVNEDTRQAVENPIDRVLAEGMIVGLANHTVLVARDGREHPIDDSGAPMRRWDGGIVGAVLVFRDISERRRAENERRALLEREREARDEAERANRIKDEFFANLSHELRTPLNSILGWAQLLRRGTLSAGDQALALESIERNARLKSQLISDLLDTNTIISGKLQVDLRPLRPSSAIDAAFESARPAAINKGVELTKTIDTCNGSILADGRRFQQIIWNLLSNAIKFTPAGGRVTVSLRRVDQRVEIVVQDTGIGISPDFLPCVFDRYRQQDTTRRRKFGGLGLGLAIVKQLVELHNGVVSVESDGEGRGATFRVLFPLFDGELDDVGGATSATVTAAGAVETLHCARILVVDDDADSRTYLQRILADGGCTVRTAASAQEALALIAVETPDVLISDIGMPDMDGYELVKQLRTMPPNAGGSIVAIALTAFARSSDQTQAAAAGYNAYHAKPVNPVDLLDTISSLLRAKEHRPAE